MPGSRAGARAKAQSRKGPGRGTGRGTGNRAEVFGVSLRPGGFIGDCAESLRLCAFARG